MNPNGLSVFPAQMKAKHSAPMNPTNAHTPGEWEYRMPSRPAPQGQIEIHKKGKTSYYIATIGIGTSHQNTVANATLIAKAPQLLAQRDTLREVLEKLVTMHTESVFICGRDDERMVESLLKSARAALAITKD